MAERGKSRGGGARTAAIAVSIVFHLVLLALLVRYAAPTAPAQVEPPAIQALLFPPARPHDARRDRLRPSSLAVRDAANRARRQARLARALPLGDVAPVIALPPTGAGLGADGDVAAGTRPALRGLGGCERAGLTRQQRQDCETQRWANAATPQPRLNLDPSGRYKGNPEPFLSRRPSKGCRARLTGESDVRGNDMNAQAGVTCVKPF
jgi:hypothetical protein